MSLSYGFYKREPMHEKVKKIEVVHTAPVHHLNYEIIEGMLGKRKARKLYRDTGMEIPLEK